MSSRTYRAAGAAAMLICVMLAGFAAPASARLGSDYDSVSADSAYFRGPLRTQSLPYYDRHDITTSAGSVIHEYLSGGKVFAVSWQGPWPPDLRQLFGDYFETMRSAAAAQSRPGAHRQLSIVQSDLVVQASEHLHTFQGRAYVPSLVPAGINLRDLP